MHLDRAERPRPERTVKAYLWDIAARPGFRPRLAALVAFGSAVVMKDGLLVAGAVLGVSIVIGVLVGYPLYRRTGRVP